MNKKGKGGLLIFGIVLLILVGMGGLFWWNNQQQKQLVESIVGGDGTKDTTTGVKLTKCPSTSIDGGFDYRNVLSSTASYLGADVVITEADPVEDALVGKKYRRLNTGTTNSGAGTTALKTVTIRCTDGVYNQGVRVFAITNATSQLSGINANSGVGVDDKGNEILTFNGGTSVTGNVKGSLLANLTRTFYYLNSTLSSTSGATTGVNSTLGNQRVIAGQEPYELANGGSITYDMFMEVATGNAQYGETGILWVIDTVDASVFSDNAISLNSNAIKFTEGDCASVYSKAFAVDSGNRCYTTPPIKSSDGVLIAQLKILADSGNPEGVNATVYHHPIMHGQDTDTSVILNTHDSAGTPIYPRQAILIPID